MEKICQDPRLIGGIHIFIPISEDKDERRNLMADLQKYLYGLTAETADYLASAKILALRSRGRVMRR